MLFRPLITLVVLTANIGNVSAMVRQKEKPSYNYPNSHPPPAPIAAAMDHSSPIMQPSTYQSSYNPQNQFPQSRVPIPVGDPSFSIAKCGHTRYNKQQIISARTEGCTRMPFYPHYPGTRKAVPYYPANFEDYQEVPPFYLYPIGKPLFNTKNGPCKFWELLNLDMHKITNMNLCCV